MARNYRQGKFFPLHPEKYRGDVHNIIYRSSWELKFLKWCDANINVIWYQSEETVVPYFNELDGKHHRYFVDFLCAIKTKTGLKTMLIEIKPHSQIVKPNVKRINEKNREKVETWIKNQQKWAAATKYATDRGWEFIVLSEHDLGITK